MDEVRDLIHTNDASEHFGQVVSFQPERCLDSEPLLPSCVLMSSKESGLCPDSSMLCSMIRISGIEPMGFRIPGNAIRATRTTDCPMLLIPYRASQWLAPISGLSVSSELAPTEDLLAPSLVTGRIHYLALCDKISAWNSSSKPLRFHGHPSFDRLRNLPRRVHSNDNGVTSQERPVCGCSDTGKHLAIVLSDMKRC